MYRFYEEAFGNKIFFSIFLETYPYIWLCDTSRERKQKIRYMFVDLNYLKLYFFFSIDCS